ncbi:MAG: c-type cytochrome biogenesis protein CcmI [Kiloniellales bacterium]
MIFWIIAGGLTTLMLVLLARPLLRRPGVDVPRAAYDVSVYRDQLAEVERDAERGILSTTEVAAARAEIERRLLAAAQAMSDADAADGKPMYTAGRALVLGIAVFLPVAAFGLYLLLGAPGVPSQPFAERPAPPEAAPSAEQAQEINRMVERLAERLAGQPGDRDGWLLLGRSYTQLGRFTEAAETYRQAISHGFDGAEAQSALGEALAAAAGGEIGPEARQAFAAALEKDPADPRARYYAGLALVQDDRLQEAIGVWTRFLEQSPPDAPWRPMVEQRIRQAAEMLGIAPPEMPAAPEAAASGPSATDIEAARQMSPDEQAAFVRSMVARLAARLAAEPDDFEGWLRLARAYGVLGERARTQEALDRAAGLIEDLPADAPERATLEAARKTLP